MWRTKVLDATGGLTVEIVCGPPDNALGAMSQVAAVKAGFIVLSTDKRRPVAAIKADDRSESDHFGGRHSASS